MQPLQWWAEFTSPGGDKVTVSENLGATEVTPVRTHSISGLKSQVMKVSFLSLEMMVKSGIEFILKLTKPL